MMFLESPAVTAPKHEWEAWLATLMTMNPRDETVRFARRSAESMLRRLSKAETEAVAHA